VLFGGLAGVGGWFEKGGFRSAGGGVGFGGSREGRSDELLRRVWIAHLIVIDVWGIMIVIGRLWISYKMDSQMKFYKCH
jgi:hypothetical protein